MYSIYKGEYVCVATTSSFSANASDAANATTPSLPLPYPHPFCYILHLDLAYIKEGMLAFSHLIPCSERLQRRQRRRLRRRRHLLPARQASQVLGLFTTHREALGRQRHRRHLLKNSVAGSPTREHLNAVPSRRPPSGTYHTHRHTRMGR